MQAIIIYWSKTGNTEKVALAVQEGLQEAGAEVTIKQVEEAEGLDWFAYDLVCIGFPSYNWGPPAPMDKYLRHMLNTYRQQGRVKPGAPVVPGKNGLVFCTYSGPHTGLREATPAVLYTGQFFEHVGFAVRGEWCIVGEFHGSVENSTQGRLGDVRGRPNAEDLRQAKQDAAAVAREIMGKG